MFLDQCRTCPAWGTAECGCPPELDSLPWHHPDCKLNDIGAVVSCKCCTQDHSHDQAAMACPGLAGAHAGEPCPHPDPVLCPAHISSTSPHAETPAHLVLDSVSAPLECPGGHCGPDVKGCTVCRPVIITMLPGGADITVKLGG